MTPKTKTAPPATEPTTEQKPKEAPAVSETTEVEAPEPFQLIPPFKISGKTKGMAKAAGIDLNSVEQMAPRINDWAASVEQRLNVILEAIPKLPGETVRVLKAEAEKRREQYQQQAQATGATQLPQGRVSLDDLRQIGRELGILSGGGEGPMQDLFNKWSQAVLTSELNRLSKPSPADAFSEAFEKAWIEAKAKAAARVITET